MQLAHAACGMRLGRKRGHWQPGLIIGRPLAFTEPLKDGEFQYSKWSIGPYDKYKTGHDDEHGEQPWTEMDTNDHKWVVAIVKGSTLRWSVEGISLGICYPGDASKPDLNALRTQSLKRGMSCPNPCQNVQGFLMQACNQFAVETCSRDQTVPGKPPSSSFQWPIGKHTRYSSHCKVSATQVTYTVTYMYHTGK